MNITKLFNEFYFLNNPDLSYKFSPKDQFMNNYLYLRIKDDFYIHYLYSSDQVIIPKEYMTIISNLDRTDGGYMEYCEISDDLDKFIYNSWKLWRGIILKNPRLNYQEIISDLVKLKTKKFQEHMKTNFSISLNSWTLKNIHNNIDI